MDKKKIMIVEDEVIVGMDLKKKVENLGYRAEPAVTRYGEEAFRAAERSKPDLVLMDIRLKGDMDGTTAASMIQEGLGVPVLFLTACSDQATLDKAKTAGPYAYLTKPVRREDLKITLDFALYKARMDKQLKESELWFRTISEYTYDWETWINPDGEYIYSSPSCRRVTGYPPERFLEDASFFYGIVHKEDQSMVRQTFSQHVKSTQTDCFSEFRIIRADGETRWLEHFCQPVHAPDGGYMGRKAGNRDITARKNLEAQLEKKVSELKEAMGSIKTLKGFLPICANCKKIRDDKGYWTTIEEYIQKHSDAIFSHGICPDCIDELYGDEDWFPSDEEEKGE